MQAAIKVRVKQTHFSYCVIYLQGPSIMEEQDLEQIGILDHSHRQKILEAAKFLPQITPIGKILACERGGSDDFPYSSFRCGN